MMNQAAHANDGALVTESPGTSSARGQAAKAAPNAMASDSCAYTDFNHSQYRRRHPPLPQVVYC